MVYSPLTLSRSHVLGQLYSRCDRVAKDIAVYLDDAAGEKLGFANESLGHYADAFTFHLSEEICKKLAGGQYTYSFDYHFAESAASASSPSKRRIKLISIFLTARKGYDKPVARSAKSTTDAPIDR